MDRVESMFIEKFHYRQKPLLYTLDVDHSNATLTFSPSYQTHIIQFENYLAIFNILIDSEDVLTNRLLTRLPSLCNAYEIGKISKSMLHR